MALRLGEKPLQGNSRSPDALAPTIGKAQMAGLQQSQEQMMGTFEGKRPAHVKPPAHLSKSPPVPLPDPIDQQPVIDEELSPVRYGDWERKGIAIDF
jgi:hypothetical protein